MFDRHCMERCTDYRGSDFARIMVNGPKQCHRVCASTEKCKYWTITDGAGDQLCTLTATSIARRPHFETVSGVKNCKKNKIVVVQDFLDNSIVNIAM